MRDEVLSVAEESDIVEGVEHRLWEGSEFIGGLLHSEPEHTWGVTASEDACPIEIKGERVLVFKHFIHCSDDSLFILREGVSKKFKGKMDVRGLRPTHHLLMRQAFFQVFDERVEAIVTSINRYSEK